MKNNKKLITILAIVIIVISVGVFYFVFGKEDTKTTLTIAEKKWIESNKNDIIDFSILNNTAILNYNGGGLFFDFLQDLEETTNLSFNKVPYNYEDEVTSEYALKVVPKVEKDQILVYEDNYAIFSNLEIKYNRIEDITDLQIGVLEDNIEDVSIYLDGADVSFKSYASLNDLIKALSKEQINSIIIPKLLYLSEVASENKLNIVYNVTEMQDNYVVTLGNKSTLNTILKKYFDKWKDENYTTTYNKYLSDMYFDVYGIDEKEQVTFRSKRYNYGYVENTPYDMEYDGEYAGYNHLFLSSFAEMANIEVDYKKYNSSTNLLKAFNDNKVDFFFNSFEDNAYDVDYQETVSIFDERVAVISNKKTDIVINSINSLKEQEVAVLKGSKIAIALDKKNIKTVLYDNLDKLLKTKQNIIAIDYDSYSYYANTVLANYRLEYISNLNTDYNYVIRGVNSNDTFTDFFNFYLGFVSDKKLINDAYYMYVKNGSTAEIFNSLLKAVVILAIVVIVLTILIKIIKNIKKNKNELSKEDKLKYVDMLTSLKNRNYLNDNIEAWDENEIYPQAIIIVDLNNIAYVNDNYGHQEGDNVIKEAANILIKNQMPNSDIIRTNGNEFLIYLLQYDEKQVISYTKKLLKEFKDLSHGFGAAIGYSVITDAIKTVDDAINEATIAMRNNKDEQ